MGRQGWYGYNRGGPRGWLRLLLPLIVGIGLGALLFGGGPRWGAYGGDYRSQAQVEQRSTAPAQAEQRATTREQAAQAEQRSAEQYAFDRGYDRGPRGAGGHRGFGFGGFGIGRFLLPLLLIGGGLWLLNRRRGPGAPGGPPSQGGPSQPVGPAPEQPSYGPGDAPTTGPTTRL